LDSCAGSEPTELPPLHDERKECIGRPLFDGRDFLLSGVSAVNLLRFEDLRKIRGLILAAFPPVA
jgi:hypothetical protein